MTTAGAITDPVLTPAVPGIILYAVGEPTLRQRALIPWEYANSRASLGSPTVSKPAVKQLLGIRAGPLCRPSREDSDWDELSVSIVRLGLAHRFGLRQYRLCGEQECSQCSSGCDNQRIVGWPKSAGSVFRGIRFRSGTHNPEVLGSNPSPATIEKHRILRHCSILTGLITGPPAPGVSAAGSNNEEWPRSASSNIAALGHGSTAARRRGRATSISKGRLLPLGFFMRGDEASTGKLHPTPHQAESHVWFGFNSASVSK
jgi:hypothetical protein